MKKIIISYDFLKEIGGLERVMFFQANHLIKDYQVGMLFGYVAKNHKEVSESLGLNKNVNISQLGSGKNEVMKLASYLLFPKRITKIKTDLIISHSFMSSRLARIKKIIDGTPYIVMMHHPPQYLYNRSIKYVNNVPRLLAYLLGVFFGGFLRRLDIESVKAADIVLANSNYTAKRIRSIYDIFPKVIYPSVADQFKMIKDTGRKKKKYLLLHGRMIKDKRPDLAVMAFAEVAKQKKDIELIISGTIEEENKIRELISKLKLESRVKILGKVSSEELVKLYNFAECFLMSAPKEDFGLTPIEAMACGCPVIAWKDGAGPEETIVEGVNGFLAEPYNIKSFSSKIIKALDRKWDKKKVSRSVDRFREDKIHKELEITIKKIMSS